MNSKLGDKIEKTRTLEDSAFFEEENILLRKREITKEARDICELLIGNTVDNMHRMQQYIR